MGRAFASGSHGHPLLFLLASLVIISSRFGALLATVPASEGNVLANLYESTGGQYWKNKDHWLSGDPCANAWYGVSCDTQNVHVLQVYVHVLLLLIKTACKKVSPGKDSRAW